MKLSSMIFVTSLPSRRNLPFIHHRHRHHPIPEPDSDPISVLSSPTLSLEKDQIARAMFEEELVFLT